MKKYIINLCLFSSLLLLNGCEEKQWPTPDIQMVPVYVLTKITGSSAPTSMEVFGEDNFVILITGANYKSYPIVDFIDNTDNTKFNIQFSTQEEFIQTVAEVEKRYLVKKEYSCSSDSIKSVFTSNLEGNVDFGYGIMTIVVDTIEGALGNNPRKTLNYTLTIRKDTRRL